MRKRCVQYFGTSKQTMRKCFRPVGSGRFCFFESEVLGNELLSELCRKEQILL